MRNIKLSILCFRWPMQSEVFPRLGVDWATRPSKDSIPYLDRGCINGESGYQTQTEALAVRGELLITNRTEVENRRDPGIHIRQANNISVSLPFGDSRSEHT